MILSAYFNLWVSGFFYLLASFFYIRSFLKTDARDEVKAFLFVRIGFVGASVFLGLEAWMHGFAFPILNFSHVLAFFSWALAFLYLIPLMRVQAQSFGLILAPVLFFLNSAALFHAGDAIYELEVQIYFALHILFAFFAYAALMLSFTAGALYLVQHYELKRRRPGTFYHKLPPLEALDLLAYFSMVLGVVLLACAVAVGFLWARDVYGQLWLHDPKTRMTLLTLALYALLVFLRFKSVVRKSRLIWAGLLVFLLMIAGFVGGRYLDGNHASEAFKKPAATQSVPV